LAAGAGDLADRPAVLDWNCPGDRDCLKRTMSPTDNPVPCRIQADVPWSGMGNGGRETVESAEVSALFSNHYDFA